jgi:hypothetical protein
MNDLNLDTASHAMKLIRLYDLDYSYTGLAANANLVLARWGSLPVSDSYVVLLISEADLPTLMPFMAEAGVTAALLPGPSLPAYQSGTLLAGDGENAWIGMTDQDYGRLYDLVAPIHHYTVCDPRHRDDELACYGEFVDGELVSVGMEYRLLDDGQSTEDGCPNCGVYVSGTRKRSPCPKCAAPVYMT